MVAQFEIRKKVNEFVEMAALGPVKSFYPTAVAKYANVPLEMAFGYLMDLTRSGEITLKWELRCPMYDCNKVIKENNSKANSFDTECPRCGHEFEVQIKDYFPKFDLNPSYKKYIQKEHEEGKKKRLLTLQA